MQTGGSIPGTPLEYIETDGVAFIDTGIRQASEISARIKCMLPSATTFVAIMGAGFVNTTSQVVTTLSPFIVNTGKVIGFFYRYRYISGAPSIAASINNQTPFIAMTRLKQNNQNISVLQQGEITPTSFSKTQASASAATDSQYLFRTNHSTPSECPNGTRIYYCQIWSDYNMTTMVRDYTPRLIGGVYGLWDNISKTFFTNAAGSGAFSGA